MDDDLIYFENGPYNLAHRENIMKVHDVLEKNELYFYSYLVLFVDGPLNNISLKDNVILNIAKLKELTFFKNDNVMDILDSLQSKGLLQYFEFVTGLLLITINPYIHSVGEGVKADVYNVFADSEYAFDLFETGFELTDNNIFVLSE
jgi:hypothetical protein